MSDGATTQTQQNKNRLVSVDQVGFREFLRRCPDYIRLYRDAGVWWLYGSSDVEVKVYDQVKRETVIYEVEEGGIKIYVSYSKAWDDKTEYVEPSQLNFHGSDCETFLTLLNHKPCELVVTYWFNNMSEKGKRQGHKCETVIVEGRRYNKNGKLLKSHKVLFNTPSYFGSIASRYGGY